MGKKARKTRWRTLEITDEQSDSEESHTTSTPRLPKTYQQKSYYNKLPYSSQSTPRRKYQYDSTKSTRSSSTTSENKITFNEEEYTRITTPRQDVLFKKGYLSKPKNYQTQTSTGTSTTSTGNSTGNGTPDHQSTDLEYDSQFVFPNGFVDQNGIYYVNSFEPYPLMLYNPPTYYTEFSNSKSKRYSTGSLTESTSPNNEEATSQDLSGGEASNNVSDYSSHQSVYNMVYPGYYVNGICTQQELEAGADQTRKIKKRRRHKNSRSLNNQDDSTECSEDEDSEIADLVEITSNQKETTEMDDHLEENNPPSDEGNPPKLQKYNLKPDAEEFIPRAYRTPEIPLSPVQFIKVPPNFVPIPVVPFNGQINPAFIPSGGIPINFLPPDPKLFPPNFVNFVPSQPKNEENSEKISEIKETETDDKNSKVCDTNSNTAKDELPTKTEKHPEKIITKGKTIDIATIVSKLEEAAKKQEENDEDSTKTPDSQQSPKIRKSFRPNQKYKTHYNRNFYNSPRNSPQRQTGDVEDSNEIKHIVNIEDTKFVKNSPERFRKNWRNGNTKWQQNGNNRNQKLHINIESNQVIKHYSDTLKKPEQVPVPKVCPKLLPHQWIPVSSRKKRKNKNVEESDASFEDGIPIEETHIDEFETYDVSMLVDVVPPSKLEEETIKVEIIEEKVENIINTIASNNLQINTMLMDIPLVTEIENELIVKEELSEEEIIVEDKIETEIIENSVEESKASKKKTKKGTQKLVTKRVIITDLDMSDKCEEIKAPMKKVVKKVDKPKEAPEIKVQEPVAKAETVAEEPEDDKKKSKKKKKKATKGGSLSSSSTTLNLTEDAYDILLDATEADKTNDEISVELEKMIQKGIYSNLEEKMRSLNLNETDGFFKSVFSKVPVAGRPEAAGFLKSADFTKIPLLKPEPVSEEHNLESKITNDELPASESPKIFLENTTNQPEEPRSLYPITEAVKEWMCRTRETTPDVDIFKSPSTIYKEFYNSDTELCNSRNLLDELSDSVEEDEITLFTTEDADKTEEDANEDLLDYWENLKPEEKNEVEKNEDDEELEVYDSKYGNNEDYLKLQTEAREKAKSMNYPRHGNLPYRAICCNVM